MASEIAALSEALDSWELVGYIAVSAVILGCAGEAIHEFTAWFRGCQWWAAKGGRASALLLVAALAVELVAQVNVNIRSGQIIAILNRETAEARERTEELKKLAAWRELSEASRNDLAKSLSAIPPSVPHSVVIAFPQNDTEALYFGAQIGVVFINLKNWNLERQARSYPGEIYWGVRVLGRPENETTAAVRKAFTDAHIEFSTDDLSSGFTTYGHPALPTDTTILVGPKKPPLEP
jgi:hypothetical protein